jgi:hypothetical protein
MLKISTDRATLTKLKEKSLSEGGMLERSGLQKLIKNNPEAFFAEIDEHLLLCGEEVRPSEIVDDRIDLLAVDEEGASVIIELKRGSHKLQLLQAISYAGMISSWTSDQFVQQLSIHLGAPIDEARTKLTDHALQTVELNKKQRIILISEAFDPALLIGIEWLSEKFTVDIRCFRVSLADDAGSEYLSCVCIFPPSETLEFAEERRRARSGEAGVWSDWEAALSNVENGELAAFVQEELDKGRENRLRDRGIMFRVNGTRRWEVFLRSKFGYVWQTGRFPEDEAQLRAFLSQPDLVTVTKGGSCLSFRLISNSDFDGFRKLVAIDPGFGEGNAVG